MAKNFTQFQEIDGTKVTDEDGVVTRTSQAEQDMYLVGYANNEPDGERRFTLKSILYTAQPSDIGLEFVTNESKETMFTDSTFTGSTTADEIIVKGDLKVEGDTVTVETVRTQTDALIVENNDTAITMQVRQESADSDYDILRVYSGEEPAMFIEGTGVASYPAKIGINTGPDPYQLNQHLSVVGNTSFYGGVSCTGNINGRDILDDGNKLDTIEAGADKTFFHLDNIRDEMAAYSLANPSTPVSIKRGFDLLEDGEEFIKIPALSAGPSNDWLTQYSPVSLAPVNRGDDGYGTWDASHQKLLSIEFEADVTGEHSQDIKYNEVPDGPWTGSKNTTYVKTTSADTERLEKYDGFNTGIRTVEYSLYGTDDGETLSREHIVSAYQEGYEWYWSRTNDLEYRDTIVPAVTGSIRNKENPDDNNLPYITPPGQAILDEVTTRELETDQIITTDVYVVSGAEIMQGISTEINVGGDILHFVNGILVRYDT